MLTVLGIVAAIVLTSTIIVSVNAIDKINPIANYSSKPVVATDEKAQAQTPNQCAPEDTSFLMNPSLSVRPPSDSAMPTGYKLEAVEDNYDIVRMYYADHPICRPDAPRNEVKNGVIIVEVSNQPDIKNISQEETMATETQRNLIEETSGNLKVDVISVHGHKAVAFDLHNGSDRVITSDGEVISDTPVSLPAMIMIFDSTEGKMYNVSAMKPLKELIPIAESIPLS